MSVCPYTYVKLTLLWHILSSWSWSSPKLMLMFSCVCVCRTTDSNRWEQTLKTPHCDLFLPLGICLSFSSPSPRMLRRSRLSWRRAVAGQTQPGVGWEGFYLTGHHYRLESHCVNTHTHLHTHCGSWFDSSKSPKYMYMVFTCHPWTHTQTQHTHTHTRKHYTHKNWISHTSVQIQDQTHKTRHKHTHTH